MGTPKSPMTLRSCGQMKQPVVSISYPYPFSFPSHLYQGFCSIQGVHQKLMAVFTPTIPAFPFPLPTPCPDPARHPSPKNSLSGSLLDLGAEQRWRCLQHEP